uniref:Uncharacterized protein n=1 Tax=Rhizophora mucronata TaxID=61149 RepID=A0A2P2NVS8_RHIMU
MIIFIFKCSHNCIFITFSRNIHKLTKLLIKQTNMP